MSIPTIEYYCNLRNVWLDFLSLVFSAAKICDNYSD